MGQTRRDFIATSALASAGLLLSNTASAFHGVTAPGDGWWLKMRRCAQHNLNEHDPQNLNIDDWVNYWSSSED